MIRQLDELDIKMFSLLNKIKTLSKCVDKQVACIILDSKGSICAVGINEVKRCDENCADKEHRICEVQHAEISAIRALNSKRRPMDRAYVSLFPCVPCQAALDPIVNEIVTFGMVHKEPVSSKLTVFPHIDYALLALNGNDHQVSIAQGELCELVTACSDHFFRTDKLESLDNLIDECIDTELQLDILYIIAQQKNPHFYTALNEKRVEKYRKVLVNIDRAITSTR